MKYSGKRIAFLGYGYEIDWAIPYFKKEGAYIIFLGHHLDNRAFTSNVDECAHCDVNDINNIIEYCKQNHVDAVISDSGETTIEKCRIINEKIGNKFFYTENQWNTFCIKDNFMNLCQKYNIATPKCYYVGNEEGFKKINRHLLKYPLVTKSTDSCGGRGCYLCKYPFELNILAKHSFLNSKSKNIIIEEYLRGQEATLTFVIQDGVCHLVSATDRYVNYKRKFKESVHSYFISPSKYAEDFMNYDFNKFSQMFLDQGLNNCSIFVQGFFINKHFVPTESGLRFEGTSTFFNNQHFNGQDFRILVWDNILKFKTDYDASKDSYLFNNKFSFYEGIFLKRSTIKSINGIEEILKLDNLFINFIYHNVGDYMSGDNSIKRLFACLNFDCKSYDDILKIVKITNKKVRIRDKYNRNMILKPMNLRKVLKTKMK